MGFAEADGEGNFFNSALLVNHQLRKCHTTRKILLYDDDKKWCTLDSQVSGIEYNFKHFDLNFPRLQKTIKCGVGICMDVNWKDFDMSLIQEKKLADHQVANETQMLIFLSAWCNPEPNYQVTDEAEEISSTVNCWADRLFPIVMSKRTNPNPFYLVACNRTGVEKTVLFLGSSVVLKLRPNLGYQSREPAGLRSQELLQAQCDF